MIVSTLGGRHMCPFQNLNVFISRVARHPLCFLALKIWPRMRKDFTWHKPVICQRHFPRILFSLCFRAFIKEAKAKQIIYTLVKDYRLEFDVVSVATPEIVKTYQRLFYVFLEIQETTFRVDCCPFSGLKLRLWKQFLENCCRYNTQVSRRV